MMPKLSLPALYAALLRTLKFFTFPLTGPHVPTQPFGLCFSLLMRSIIIIVS